MSTLCHGVEIQNYRSKWRLSTLYSIMWVTIPPQLWSTLGSAIVAIASRKACELSLLWRLTFGTTNRKLRSYYILTSVMSSFVMSLPLLYPKTLGNGCAQFEFPSLLLHFPPTYHMFWHLINPSKTSNHMLAHITLSLLWFSLCVISKCHTPQ